MSGFHSKDIPGATDLRVWHLAASPDAPVVRVAGTLDGTAASDLETRLNSILHPTPSHLLFDLGSVDYVSSMGLSAVLKTVIRLKNAGANCWLYDPQHSVRRVFEIAKWDRLILDPASLSADSPFFGYVCDEEPARAARRKKSSAIPPRLYPEH